METGGRDDQPQLRLEPAGDQRRGDEHRRRLRGRADRRRRRAHGPRPDDEGLQPLPRPVPPPQRGDHEHGADRRIPGGEVPHPARASRTSSPCAATSSPPRRPTRGEFQNEIIPTWGRDEAGRKVLLTTDQCIRRDTLARGAGGACRRPSIPTGGSVTAGNSSPINVGAAALLIMSEEKARSWA